MDPTNQFHESKMTNCPGSVGDCTGNAHSERDLVSSLNMDPTNQFHESKMTNCPGSVGDCTGNAHSERDLVSSLNMDPTNQFHESKMTNCPGSVGDCTGNAHSERDLVSSLNMDPTNQFHESKMTNCPGSVGDCTDNAHSERDLVSPLDMDPPSQFHENEKILCFDGPLIYEAKCIKVRFRNNKAEYFIHYMGWNKCWDEWVPESRLLKYDDTNLQKKKELDQAYIGSKKSKPEAKPKKSKPEAKPDKSKPEAKPDKSKPEAKPDKSKHEAKPDKSKHEAKPDEEVDVEVSSTSSEERPRRRRRTTVAASVASNQPSTSQATCSCRRRQQRKRSRQDTHVEPGEVVLPRVDYKVCIPEELKPWLLDDWYLVTKQKMLVQLPCSITVDEILTEYVKEKISAMDNPSQQKSVIEMADGLKKYFNVMLGSQLLYKFERLQYAEILEERGDTPMSQLYGSIHLLRLFVRLESMLRSVPLEKASVEDLLVQVEDLLKFMVKYSEVLFKLDDYDTATAEYARRFLA